MSELEIYAFVDEDDNTLDFTTPHADEARNYATEHRLRWIALEYEYADTTLVEDHRPGRALTGEKL